MTRGDADTILVVRGLKLQEAGFRAGIERKARSRHITLLLLRDPNAVERSALDIILNHG